jgi:hypothetical protein
MLFMVSITEQVSIVVEADKAEVTEDGCLYLTVLTDRPVAAFKVWVCFYPIKEGP